MLARPPHRSYHRVSLTSDPGHGREAALLWRGTHRPVILQVSILDVGFIGDGICCRARCSLRHFTPAGCLRLGSGGTFAAFLGCTHGWHLMTLSSLGCVEWALRRLTESVQEKPVALCGKGHKAGKVPSGSKPLHVE